MVGNVPLRSPEPVLDLAEGSTWDQPLPRNLVLVVRVDLLQDALELIAEHPAWRRTFTEKEDKR